MSEFKTILSAPLYEINKEGYIQTIDKKSPIFPHPRGSDKVKLKLSDGTREPFLVSQLIEEAFGIKLPKSEDFIFESPSSKSNGANVDSTSQPMGLIHNNALEEKIMSLDTFTSVKIWKLHEAGIKKERIMELVGPKNQNNVAQTISNFKKSQKLRDKADKVKI